MLRLVFLAAGFIAVLSIVPTLIPPAATMIAFVGLVGYLAWRAWFD